KYTDEYRDNLMRIIHAKLKGRKPKLQEVEVERQSNVVDLMERLRASLAGAGKSETTSRRKASNPKQGSRQGSRQGARQTPRKTTARRGTKRVA
ncbi:MAG TPA: hypothetical protein VFJ02_04250, partial [Vicinamibacterales bacterium]|nr:hypothetical protein [Vicinamibacterales bacterium]